MTTHIFLKRILHVILATSAALTVGCFSTDIRQTQHDWDLHEAHTSGTRGPGQTWLTRQGRHEATSYCKERGRRVQFYSEGVWDVPYKQTLFGGVLGRPEFVVSFRCVPSGDREVPPPDTPDCVPLETAGAVFVPAAPVMKGSWVTGKDSTRVMGLLADGSEVSLSLEGEPKVGAYAIGPWKAVTLLGFQYKGDGMWSFNALSGTLIIDSVQGRWHARLVDVVLFAEKLSGEVPPKSCATRPISIPLGSARCELGEPAELPRGRPLRVRQLVS